MTGRFRHAALAALVAAIVGVSPYETPPHSVAELPPALVLPVGDPMPALESRR